MSVPKHVLVAESDEQTRVHVAGALRASGYATTESATGRDALRSIQAERPDVVIVGVTLPDIGGRDLARILASNGDRGPISTIVAAEPGTPEEDMALPGAPEMRTGPVTASSGTTTSMAVPSSLTASARTRTKPCAPVLVTRSNSTSVKRL